MIDSKSNGKRIFQFFFMIQERPPWVLDIVKNVWVVGAPSRTPLGSSQCSPRRPLVGEEGACCPHSKNPIPHSVIGLDFRPFGLIRHPLQHSLFHPQCLGGWIKNWSRPWLSAVSMQDQHFKSGCFVNVRISQLFFFFFFFLLFL